MSDIAALKAHFEKPPKDCRAALLADLNLPEGTSDDALFAALFIALREARASRPFSWPYVVPCTRPHSDEAKPWITPWPNTTPIWRIPMGTEQPYYTAGGCSMIPGN